MQSLLKIKMSPWKDAVEHAKSAVEAIDLPADFEGAECRIAGYASLADYRFFRPDETDSLTWHRMLTRALARELRRRNAHPKIITIDRDAYLDWLIKSNLEETAPSRAVYIAALTDALD